MKNKYNQNYYTLQFEDDAHLKIEFLKIITEMTNEMPDLVIVKYSIFLLVSHTSLYQLATHLVMVPICYYVLSLA